MIIATILRVGMAVVNAVGDANRRRAEREIARVIRRDGGGLADGLEREPHRSLPLRS